MENRDISDLLFSLKNNQDSFERIILSFETRRFNQFIDFFSERTFTDPERTKARPLYFELWRQIVAIDRPPPSAS